MTEQAAAPHEAIPRRSDRGTRKARRRSPTTGVRPRWVPAFLVILLLMLLALYALGLYALQPPSPGRALTLDQLIRATAKYQVHDVTFLDADHRIVGTGVFTPGSPQEQFWTSYPQSDAVTDDIFKTLYGFSVTVRWDAQDAKQIVRFVEQYLLPLMILADLFALLFYISTQRTGSGAEDFVHFGRLGDRLLRRRRAQTQTTFADVAAVGEAVEELAEVRDYLANPEAYVAIGAQPPKGVLLVGPPGCGKTLLARAVAGEASADFYSVSGSEFVESLVGVGAARVRDLFRQARLRAPAIIFIDELDAVGRQRGAGLGQGHDEREQTLNELLVQMDGFSAREGIVVMAATNRPDILDPALLRAGRFDRHVTVDRPDREGRLAILRLHAAGKRFADPDADLAYVAQQTPGFTGADLANVLNEAALLSVRHRETAITRGHLEEAVERVVGGPRRRAHVITPPERRRIACHEASHAVVAAAMGKTPLLQKVSIVARGRGVGHLAVLQGDTSTVTRDDLAANIAIAVAGFAGEELVLGQASTGSEPDLERATNIARDMAGRYGMSANLGLMRVLREDREVFLGRDYLLARDVSPPTLERLDDEIARILEEQHRIAADILRGHRAELDALSGKLVEVETLQGADLERALSRVRPHLQAVSDS